MNHKVVAFSALCIGLDNSGKTTLLRNLSNSNRMEIFPTANMEIHYVQCPKAGKQCVVYDMSGNGRHRSNWKLLFNEIQAIIYVIDSSDSEDRFTMQKMLLDDIFQDEIIKKNNQPFLFLLNKQDKEAKYNKEDIIKDLGLDQKKYKNKLFFKETSGFTGLGLKEAIDILSDALFSKKI